MIDVHPRADGSWLLTAHEGTMRVPLDRQDMRLLRYALDIDGEISVCGKVWLVSQPSDQVQLHLASPTRHAGTVYSRAVLRRQLDRVLEGDPA